MMQHNKADGAVILLLSAVVISGLLFPTRADGDDVGLRTVEPYVTWSGAHSVIERREYARVTSERGWRTLWQRHAGTKSHNYAQLHNVRRIPIIDFNKCMVIAIFGGELMCTQGGRTRSVTENGEFLRIRFFVENVTVHGERPMTPYAILVLPKTAKPVILEQLGPNDSRGDPTWNERKRFDALEQQ